MATMAISVLVEQVPLGAHDVDAVRLSKRMTWAS
jgi:hypothetical protein